MSQQSVSLLNILRCHISGQLVGRLSTFLINLYLIRHVDGDILGLINVRLNLLYMTIGFLCTEPLRKVCLSADLRIAETVKYAWLSPLLAVVVGSVLSVIWSHLPVQEAVAQYDYQILIQCFLIAAVFESLAEPFAILCLKGGDNATFAIAQSVLLVANKFSVLLLLLYGVDSKVALCLGQLIGSVIYTLIFYVKFAKLSLLNRINYSPWFSLSSTYDWQYIRLIGTIFFHSLQKQLITDGSGYVMTFTQKLTFTEQAVYDAIERLGSLVARIILRPLEESCAIYFSAHFSRNQHTAVPRKLLDMLMAFCRLLITLGLIVCIFSIPYSPLAVQIYGGKLLVENRGALLLSMYAFYLVVMAISGIVECFAFSSMNAASIFSHGKFLLVTSLAHLVTNIVLLKLYGAPGFILANIIHMAMRTAYNWHYIKGLANTESLSVGAIVPDFNLFILLLVTLMITGLSGLIFASTPGLVYTGAHLAVGGVMFLLIVAYLHQTGELYQRLWEKLD